VAVSRRRARSRAAVGHRPPPPRRLPDEEPSLRHQIVTKFVPAAGLLPLRLFFGATFLYAGLDKLTTSTFFDPSSAASIQSQMAAFARTSPIGGLVRLGEPFAVAIGLLIALAEIAIGIGALSGLAFRLAAFAGAGLSLLFWLTASWSTHPYYYGPDLPYAVGWIALGLAGHGGFLVSRRFLGESDGEPPGRAMDRAHPDVVPSPERRAIIQAALLGGAAIAVASLAVPLRLLGRTSDAGGVLDGPLPSDDVAAGGSPGASPGAGQPTPAPSATLVGGNVAIATVAAVQRTGALAFTVPFSAPAPLPAGDPGIVVRLSDGSYVAFDAVCTHAGCTVEWDAPDKVLYCPCHGAAFDPANHAAVLGGPTNQPLASLPIVVDAASGKIFLRA
jgi:thiosulfate dehydrogenase [quinone] large subunit